MSDALRLEQIPGKFIPYVTRPIEILAASAVPVSCSGVGAGEMLASIPISPGVIGPNSIIQIEPFWQFTSSANQKILYIKIGPNEIYAVARTTSSREAPLIILACRNSLSSQIVPIKGNYHTAATGAVDLWSINFSFPQMVEIYGNRANAGDILTLEYYRVLHYVGE